MRCTTFKIFVIRVRPSPILSKYPAELLGPVPLHRHLRKPRRSGARYIDAGHGRIHQWLGRGVGFGILNGSAGGLGPSTGKHHGETVFLHIDSSV